MPSRELHPLSHHKPRHAGTCQVPVVPVQQQRSHRTQRDLVGGQSSVLQRPGLFLWSGGSKGACKWVELLFVEALWVECFVAGFCVELRFLSQLPKEWPRASKISKSFEARGRGRLSRDAWSSTSTL